MKNNISGMLWNYKSHIQNSLGSNCMVPLMLIFSDPRTVKEALSIVETVFYDKS